MPTSGFTLVVGCQRSGTTLLGQMLGAHPEAFLVDEDEGAYLLLDALLHAQPVEPVLARLLPRARLKYRDGRRLAAEPSHVILKVPNATFFVRALRQVQARMSTVFAVRDVREVVHSMMQLQQVPIIENQRRRMGEVEEIATRYAAQIATLGDPGVPPHVKYATIWRVKTGLYRDFLAAPLNALLVPYAALVRDGPHWQARLHAHAGLVPAAVAHHEVMQGTAVGMTERGRAVDTGSLGQWPSHLSAAQLADIRAVAGGLMDELAMPW